MKKRSIATAICLAVIAGLTYVPPAGAHSVTRTDRNDVPGPLDIKRITASHTATKVIHKIQTHGRWSPRVLRRDNFLLGWFSTDADKRDAERLLFIFYQRGRLRGVVTNARGRALFAVRVSRPNGRTVRWSFGVNQLTTKGGYAWGGFSYYKAAGRCSDFCIDASPNRGPVGLDYTPPVVDIVTQAPNGLASDLSTDAAEVPLDIAAMDKGASRTIYWRLQTREVGTSTWTTQDSDPVGNNLTPREVMIDLQGGKTYDVRLTADDGPHAATTSMRLVVPLDESDGTVVGGFSPGDWSGLNDFDHWNGTYHSTGISGATFSYSFTGSEVWLVGRGGPVTVAVDGGAPVAIDTMPTGNREVFYHQQLAEGSHTVVVTTTSTSETVIDAVASR